MGKTKQTLEMLVTICEQQHILLTEIGFTLEIYNKALQNANARIDAIEKKVSNV